MAFGFDGDPLKPPGGIGSIKTEDDLERFVRSRFDNWYSPPNLTIPDGSIGLAKLGFQLAWGSDSVTGHGGALSLADTVAHGLPSTPTFVAVISRNPSFAAAANTPDATNIYPQLQRIDGTGWVTTESYYWLAIA